MRKRYLDDERAKELAQKFELGDLDGVERRQLDVKLACTHGDLHGCNVLIGVGGQPSLIDYGDVGEACACADPITLELCIFSHPAAAALKKSWRPDFSVPWVRPAQYAASSPFPAFIQATRAWSHAVALGDHDVYANAYAYCFKQLKYDDTDKDFFVRAIADLRRGLLGM